MSPRASPRHRTRRTAADVRDHRRRFRLPLSSVILDSHLPVQPPADSPGAPPTFPRRRCAFTPPPPTTRRSSLSSAILTKEVFARLDSAAPVQHVSSATALERTANRPPSPRSTPLDNGSPSGRKESYWPRSNPNPHPRHAHQSRWRGELRLFAGQSPDPHRNIGHLAVTPYPPFDRRALSSRPGPLHLPP